MKGTTYLLRPWLAGLLFVLSPAAFGQHVHEHVSGPAGAGAFQSNWDFFTNFGQYMNRTHCMRLADGSPDWLWINILIALTGGVIASYLKIFVFWRRSYLEVPLRDRNTKLMDLAYVFLLCAVCGYAMSIVTVFWPAYRLLALLLVALNFFSWRFAGSLNAFKVSLRAKALQRELDDEIRNRNTHLERLVSEQTTALRQSEADAQLASRTDKLTGLLNRGALSERLKESVERARQSPEFRFAVLFLDLDRFKTINDCLGHHVGDGLLSAIGARLRELLSNCPAIGSRTDSAMAFRLGGDEFVVVLDGIKDAAIVIHAGQRILQELGRPFFLAEHEVYANASVGIATSDSACQNADDVLRDADTALYEAKLSGKGRAVVFDASMRQRVRNRLGLEIDLRKALEAKQFFLVYQPIISLDSARVEGFEALLRWRHPVRGMVSPADFIPIAEDTGMIIAIGEWVLREACMQLARWRAANGDEAPKSISVNLSRNQLASAELPAVVRRALHEAHIPASSLHLEITESTIMRDMQSALKMMQTLKDIGVRLDMDDFGTGHSSLACLHQFPLDVLKIDRSFVANMERGRDFMSLVQAISILARNLDIDVVAEGIETAEQVMLLQAMDCQFGQGYYLGKPMSGEDAGKFKLPAELLQHGARESFAGSAAN